MWLTELKIKNEGIVIGGLMGALFLLLIVFLASYATTGERPTIRTAHVINLDRDAKKLASFRDQSLPFPVERWAATYGKDLEVKALPAQGIGNIIVQSGKGSYRDQWKDLRNLGAVGCFLSHRSLLQHCATLPVPNTEGHLVLEDDAVFPEDFQKRWDEVRQRIPVDWDIVYLGLNGAKGDAVSAGILKLYTVKDSGGNWGTHAYIVRHGALRSKVLPTLERMFDAIDGQFNAYFDTWNVYAVEPTLVDLDKELESTIQTM
jgi:GR25 family glycosyltransferase involved in LPS biosynthesis